MLCHILMSFITSQYLSVLYPSIISCPLCSVWSPVQCFVPLYTTLSSCAVLCPCTEFCPPLWVSYFSVPCTVLYCSGPSKYFLVCQSHSYCPTLKWRIVLLSPCAVLSTRTVKLIQCPPFIYLYIYLFIYSFVTSL